MTNIVSGLRRIAEEGYRFAGDAADEIERLRAGLEAAEAECLEQARLNDMGSEREAALMAKLEAACRDYKALEGYYAELAEKLAAANRAVDEAYQRGYATGQEEIAAELEFAKQEIANLHDDISEWMDKCDALRAKIEAMERQEPVRWFYVTNCEWDCYSRERPPEDAYDAGSLMALYALPGAKGEEK